MIETQLVNKEEKEKEEKIAYTDTDGKRVIVSLKKETVENRFVGGKNDVCMVCISDSEEREEVEIADWLMEDVRKEIQRIADNKLGVESATGQLEKNVRDNTYLYGYSQDL